MYSKFKVRPSTLQGVSDVYGLEPGESMKVGRAEISCFEVNQNDVLLVNARYIRDGQAFCVMFPGIYTRLKIDGNLVMSDTNMERLTNEQFVEKAHGRVLIAGLGIGLVLKNLYPKLETGEISEIVVMEYYKDVINLVKPAFKHKKIKIRHGDIHKMNPKKKFDTIYFDIWNEISEDNLPDMKALHQKFSNHLNEGGYINSWMKEYLLRRRAEEPADYSSDFMKTLEYTSSIKL